MFLEFQADTYGIIITARTCVCIDASVFVSVMTRNWQCGHFVLVEVGPNLTSPSFESDIAYKICNLSIRIKSDTITPKLTLHVDYSGFTFHVYEYNETSKITKSRVTVI